METMESREGKGENWERLDGRRQKKKDSQERNDRQKRNMRQERKERQEGDT